VKEAVDAQRAADVAPVLVGSGQLLGDRRQRLVAARGDAAAAAPPGLKVQALVVARPGRGEQLGDVEEDDRAIKQRVLGRDRRRVADEQVRREHERDDERAAPSDLLITRSRPPAISTFMCSASSPDIESQASALPWRATSRCATCGSNRTSALTTNVAPRTCSRASRNEYRLFVRA
jgi:hypothetical protein